VPSAKKQVRPVSPEVTLLRMKNIVQAECQYRITGVASVSIIEPHCAIALFMLTRGAMTVYVNGERSGFKWALTQAEGHRDFERMHGELRQTGPIKLRHLNE